MTARRIGAMMGGVALVAATALFVPGALDAAPAKRIVGKRAGSAAILGTFTPVAADPRLAALMSRAGLDGGSFRFTPAEVKDTSRSVTVAVRARTNRSIDTGPVVLAAAEPQGGLKPIAYNLGVAVGWKRFAVSGDVGRVDLASRPGGREAADVAVSYAGGRFTGRVRAAADRPLADAPKLVEEAPSYSVDLGGSYRLTHNLDVTAGVRYRTERERLTQIETDRRDSQAVYIGTAFRF